MSDPMDVIDSPVSQPPTPGAPTEKDDYQSFTVTCKFSGDHDPVDMIGIFQTWLDPQGFKRKSVEPGYVLFEPSLEGLEKFITKIRAAYAAGVANPREYKPGVVNTPFRKRIHRKIQ